MRGSCVIIAVDGGDIEYTAKPRLLERGRTQLQFQHGA